MAGGGYKKGQAGSSAKSAGRARGAGTRSVTRGAGTRSVTVRKGMRSETKVNAGVAKMARKMLPTAAKPIRPRGAAASLRPRVAREATEGKPVPKVRALVKKRGKSSAARSK